MGISYNVPFVSDRLREPYLRFYAKLRFLSPRDGLKRIGPFSAYKLNRINIGVVSESSIIGGAIKLVDFLINGFDSYYTGLRDIFKVDEINGPEGYTLQIDSNEVTWDAIRNSYLQVAESLPGDGVVLFFLDDRTLDKYYASIKALRFDYAPKTVRVQVIRKSTLSRILRDPVTLKFSLLNIASSIYAKACGTPWVHDGPIIPAGIFIGIAFTRPKVLEETRMTKEVFYYGVLTVYNKFGKHLDTRVKGLTIEVPRVKKLRGTKGLYVPKEDMIKLLNQILAVYRPPIVVIHKSSRFHREEKEAVEMVLGNKGVDYVLVHVESNNPYRGFSKTVYRYNIVRGDLLVDVENNDRVILFTTGCVQEGNNLKPRTRPGTPRPLELEIEANTSPFGPRELAEQILSLTKLDWNTTDIEIRMPITIKYASKASKLAPYIEGKVVEIRDLM